MRLGSRIPRLLETDHIVQAHSERRSAMATMMPPVPSDMLQMLSRMERFLTGTGMSDEDEGTLALDIYEQNDALVVEASVPGFERNDIAIQLHQGLLSIVASRPAQREGSDSGRRYFRRERPV